MTPAPVSVVVSPSDTLAVGSYSGQVVFTGGGTSLTVNVTLVVAPAGGAVFDSTPAQLSFSMRPGGEPASQVMQIGNGGIGTLNWLLIGSTFNGVNFLSPSAQTGTAPTQITLRVLPEKLPNGGATAGVYTGQLLFLASGSTVTVPVRVLVADADSDETNSPGFLKPLPGARTTLLTGTTNLYPPNTMNVVCGGFININTAYGGYDTSTLGAPDGTTDSGRLITEANPGSGSVEHYRISFSGCGRRDMDTVLLL